MIARLRGKLLEKHANLAVVEAAGVGYAVTISVSTFSQLGESGAEVSLHTFTHVREDALALFGFITREEKALFEKLIAVSGIGPRLAVTILSGLEASELTTAIRGGDVARITRIPGVGKKTGERIVLELREKLAAVASEVGDPAAAAPAVGPSEEVISALMNLGSKRDIAEQAVRKAFGEVGDSDFERLFRRSLDLISR